MDEPIYVTKTFLPPRAEYDAWVDKVYASHVLTNNGPVHRELEETLRQRFDVPHLKLMANGTLALQLAIRALGVTGKVITTPFSYVATTSAIIWEGCEPIFVDIDPKTCCIDADLIEAAITPNTTAILATHVYGIPCDVEAIDAIAKKHGLKVIYDAAHAFDVSYKGKSILAWGDASTLSFHATKLFHTVEGGAVISHSSLVDDELSLLRSFGHVYDDHFQLGINSKMSELHASMGMAVLPHVDDILKKRIAVYNLYHHLLDPLVSNGIISFPVVPDGTVHNHAYCPIILSTERQLLQLMESMSTNGVFLRRYFYPSLSTLNYVKSAKCLVSESIAPRVLCLPTYFDLGMEDVVRISEGIVAFLKANEA